MLLSGGLTFTNGWGLLTPPAPATISTYSLIPSTTNVTQGSNITITLVTSNVAVNTSVPYQISGNYISDNFVYSIYSDAFVVNSAGQASITFATAPNNILSNVESFTVSLTNANANCTVNVYDTTNVSNHQPLVIAYDVSYGSDALQKVDVVAPQSGNINGIVVYLHPGGWSGGSKSTSGFPSNIAAGINSNTESAQANILATAGYYVINCNYRLASNAAYGYGGTNSGFGRAPVDDVKTIIKCLTIDGYGANLDSRWAFYRSYVDSKKLLVAGYSAGGHLAMMGGGEMMGTSQLLAIASIDGPMDLDYGTRWSPDTAQKSTIDTYTQSNVITRQDVSPYWRYSNYNANVGRSPSLYPYLQNTNVKFFFVQNTNDTFVTANVSMPFANSLPRTVIDYITEGTASTPDSHNLTSPISTYLIKIANSVFYQP